MSAAPLRTPSNDDYAFLAWLLRSRPGFLRKETVREWCYRVLLPEDLSEDQWKETGIAAGVVGQTLLDTFNENAPQWLDFNYFAYAAKAVSA